MVIYDTKNNYNGRIKGMLYLSLMDADYLLNKYGEDTLKENIPSDYVEYFKEELGRRRNEEKLSEQYYPILSVGIENDKDEELVKIIKKEVEEDNLFTKKELSEIPAEKLEGLIKTIDSNIDKLNIQELYKLRSYMMALYITRKIEKAKKLEVTGYEDGFFEYNNYSTITNNLKIMGLSDSITESDYFIK